MRVDFLPSDDFLAAVFFFPARAAGLRSASSSSLEAQRAAMKIDALGLRFLGGRGGDLLPVHLGLNQLERLLSHLVLELLRVEVVIGGLVDQLDREGEVGLVDVAFFKGQLEAIEAGLAAAMVAGAPADGERATDLAEEARQHIDRWFYRCSHSMHSGLADMYTADERFKANYEKRGEGLAEYVATAIKANQARQEA